jgi:hypothetical protein
MQIENGEGAKNRGAGALTVEEGALDGGGWQGGGGFRQQNDENIIELRAL